MKIRIETFMTLFLLIVTLLAGCGGCEKKPKTSLHGGMQPKRKVVWQPQRFPKLPRDLKKRLDKAGTYHTNPRYYQDVYDIVGEGLDTQETVDLLLKYNIYTAAALKHMDNYTAYKYIQSARRGPGDSEWLALVYAKRVFEEDPSDVRAITAGLYYGLKSKREDPQLTERVYRELLKHHPDSARALHALGKLILDDKPKEAFGYLLRASTVDPYYNNSGSLAVAYEYMGDYKKAWMHYRIHLEYYPNSWYRGLMQRIEYTGLPNFGPMKGKWIKPPPADPFITVRSPEETFRTRLGPPPEEYDKELQEQYRIPTNYFYFARKIIDEVSRNPKNALAKDFEAHLLGKKTTIATDRLNRAAEMIQRLGSKKGLKELRKTDPKIASQLWKIFR